VARTLLESDVVIREARKRLWPLPAPGASPGPVSSQERSGQRRGNLSRSRQRPVLAACLPRLVLAGQVTQAAEAWVAEARKPPIGDRVVVEGYVSHERRAELYAGASALALPSLDEGFGLPALEAMALGIPVVASNAGALPEVVGDAGLLVDPADVDGLARALERVHVDGGLAARLREAGIDRARQFSWTESVRTLLRAYEDALGRTVSSRRPKRGARA